jgi:hypothetical protein
LFLFFVPFSFAFLTLIIDFFWPFLPGFALRWCLKHKHWKLTFF